VARATPEHDRIGLSGPVQNPIDQACLKLAADQHWVLTHDQALGLGLSPRSVGRRLSSGFLVPLHSSVYRVAAGPESWHQRLLGACMWTSGVASHRAALKLLGIEGYSGHIVEVTSATTKRASTKIVRFHQRSSLPAGDLMRVGSIPTTTPTRSLLDVGAVISQKGLEEALDSALRQRLTSVDRLRGGGAETRRARQQGAGCTGQAARRPRRCGPYGQRLGDAAEPVAEAPSLAATPSLLDSPESGQVEVRDALGFIGRVDFAYPELKIAIEVQSHRLRRGRNWDSIDGILTGPPGARIWTG